MSDGFVSVNTSQYQKISQQWNSVLKLGESVCLVFPYLSDRHLRLKQYTDSLKDSSLIPITFHPSLDPIDEINNLKNLINQQLPVNLKKDNLDESLSNKTNTIVFVVSEGETLIKPEYEFLLDLLQNICLSFSNIKTLIAFDSDVFRIIPDFNKYNLLFQNIVYYPLYSSEDMMFFVAYLCHKWSIKMPQPVRKSIVYHSGGFFGLAKEACRIYRNTSDWSPQSPGFQFRLNSIIKSLSTEEKNIIISAPHLKSFEKSQALAHLKQISLIKEDDSVYLPDLVDFINKNKEPVKLFETENEEIFLRGISLFRFLSASEYLLLKLFISKPNISVTRDEIAKILWPGKSEENYSQWAIDQAIKRLRDRLVSLKLPPTVIKSIRGVGYEFRT